MDKIFTKSFWKSAAERAIKTAAQIAIVEIGTATKLGQVDFKTVVSAAILGVLLSIVTSIATLKSDEDTPDSRQTSITMAGTGKDDETVSDDAAEAVAKGTESQADGQTDSQTAQQ